jgi:filamentous hemagglutinin
MMCLMDAGLLAQAQLSLSAGEHLSPAQQAALTQDMVWPEWQEVDGQRVLLPHVYLVKASVQAAAANAASTAGARIAGAQLSITTDEINNTGTLAASNSLAINAAGKVSGGGSYSGGKTLAIVADTVDLKSASIQSSGWLSIDTAKDLTLTATQIKAAGDASLTAGGELSLKAQEFNTKVVRGDGTSRTETKYETSNINAGGTVVLSAKKDLTLEGSKVDAGNNLLVESKQGNVNLVARKEVSDYSYNGEGALAEIQAREKANAGEQQDFVGGATKAAGHTQVHEESVQNVRLTSKGNATVQANQGGILATALDVNAGKDITLQAGGVVQIDAMQANGGTLKAGNDVLINGGQVALSHTAAQAGRDIKVEATDGGVVLKAVDMQAQRNFYLSSAGDVAVVSEVATSSQTQANTAQRSGWLGGLLNRLGVGNTTVTTTASETSRIKAGNQANVTALGDLTVQGGDVQAKDINLMALGDVTLTGVQNKTVTQRGGNDTTAVTTTQSLNLKGDNINIQGVGASSDVTIASGENRTTREWTTRDEDCNWYGKCTTTVTHGVQDKTTQVGSDVKGASVEVSAGKDLTTVTSTIEGGSVSLSAQGKIDYLAALNVGF